MDNAAVREFKGIHNMIRGLAVTPGVGRVACQSGRFEADEDARRFWLVYGCPRRALPSHDRRRLLLARRCQRNGADPALLEPLVEEHHMIDPLLDETQSAFARLKSGPISSGSVEPLGKPVGRFKEDMLRHLDNEEPIFFPLLAQYMPDDESERIAAVLAKKAPRKGISWLMGGVEYGMTKEQAAEFLATFPKPIQWLHPLLLNKYRKNCRILGIDPATPSQR